MTACGATTSEAQTVPPPQVDAPAPHDAVVGVSAIYTSDANADIAGGSRTGAAYLQRIGLIGDVDLARAIGWNGARAHISVQSIIGSGLSSSRVGNMLTVSGIEAEPAFRLFNAWVEQSIGTRLTIRIGQFNADQQFAISPAASLFVNSTFGWPGSFAADLPSGGPVYPLAAPGASVWIKASKRTTIGLAVFTGDPGGPGGGDPQRRNLHGFNAFRLRGGPFLIGEVQHVGDETSSWSMTIGAWAHFDRFYDLRPDRSAHGGNYALYAIGNVRLWRSGSRALEAFIRTTVSPPDRNAIDFYMDGGVTLTGPLQARPRDTVGLGVAFARLSSRLRTRYDDSCAALFLTCRAPLAEAVVEASYQIQIDERLHVQPNVQWILNPSAAVLAPLTVPAPPTANALVAGLRTSLRF